MCASRRYYESENDCVGFSDVSGSSTSTSIWSRLNRGMEEKRIAASDCCCPSAAGSIQHSGTKAPFTTKGEISDNTCYVLSCQLRETGFWVLKCHIMPENASRHVSARCLSTRTNLTRYRGIICSSTRRMRAQNDCKRKLVWLVAMVISVLFICSCDVVSLLLH